MRFLIVAAKQLGKREAWAINRRSIFFVIVALVMAYHFHFGLF